MAFRLCTHTGCPRLSWDLIEEFGHPGRGTAAVRAASSGSFAVLSLHDPGHESICANPSHMSRSRDVRQRRTAAEDLVKECPRLFIASSSRGLDSLGQAYFIIYGWDAPVVELPELPVISPTVPIISEPDARAVREIAAKMLPKALEGRAYCSHLSTDSELRGLARATLCQHFLSQEHVEKVGTPSCRVCDQRNMLNCRLCGATFFWKKSGKLISLCYRYVWKMEKPTSRGWLGLLDEKAYREMVYSENTRHVLWCEVEGCWTGKARR